MRIGLGRCWVDDTCTFYLRTCALILSELCFFTTIARPTGLFTCHIQMTLNKCVMSTVTHLDNSLALLQARVACLAAALLMTG